MFSYHDDAIVTIGPTGRPSSVIRRPATIGPLDWAEHAAKVCRVLNEMGQNAKAHSLSLHRQTCDRVTRRPIPRASDLADPEGPTFAELIGQGYLSPTARATQTEAMIASARIAELEKPAVISLETAALRVFLNVVGVGSLLSTKADCGRTVIIKRVE